MSAEYERRGDDLHVIAVFNFGRASCNGPADVVRRNLLSKEGQECVKLLEAQQGSFEGLPAAPLVAADRLDRVRRRIREIVTMGTESLIKAELVNLLEDLAVDASKVTGKAEKI